MLHPALVVVASIEERYRSVRARSVALSAPLSVEDQCVQPMPDASPTKWHLAHTSWFFEELVLDGDRFDPEFHFLFNSYYEALGPRVSRARRGMVTRPSLERVHDYRDDVDKRVLRALERGALDDDALARLELGLHHEQQHQELILTDIAFTLGTQPGAPAYRADLSREVPRAPEPMRFRSFEGGIADLGAPSSGFAFDNERPRHRELAAAFDLATRPISNAEVLDFIADGGYESPLLWLSDGWQTVKQEGWHAPLYWNDDGTLWDLSGTRAIDPSETACHLSFYEADAIARFCGGRLPTEVEWEIAAATHAPEHGNFADDDRLQPARARGDALAQMFGDVWEWTRSSYAPYPGFRPLAGALAEYNGKFMSGQHVLRGGSCFTPRGHVRASYRNFFPPSARWQMCGVRIARDP
ncbi:MAG TPA: ergothioneine biosynthesis protein EgtB [Polyangiaceae bacterium]|nr:ergothioneine biosynthesis protein EgtB [Polyangiaceae bacterium]